MCKICHYSWQYNTLLIIKLLFSSHNVSDYNACNAEDTRNACTKCDSDQHRVLITTKCKCNYGWYDDGQYELCKKCHYSW